MRFSKMLVPLLFLFAGPAQAQPVLVAMGDSLTQGYGLPQDQGFVPQLQDWLTQQGNEVTVINAGVSGDTSSGGLARVDWSLTPDVGGMILALGANDVLRGTDPSLTRANIEGILRAAQSRDLPVLLIGLSAPANYGPAYQQSFDAIWPELAQKYDAVYAPSFFEGFATDDPAALRGLMQADGLHPNAEGVGQIVEGLGPYVQDLLTQLSK